jgi:tRNA A-37 threonylcarbamoyl transferase component Bud32
MEQARIPERYRLIEEVGQGGMAVVYRAQDETLKREVAIKILHQHLAGEADSKARLEREAQAVAKLRHENILEIFDYSGTGSATSYIVTEFIDGQTLKQFLGKHQPRFPEIAALICVEVCRALGHAHGLGVIHRDVKPENVMIRKDGLIKLMDFGIAQVLDFQRMTVTGQLLGSPAYMAPEIIEGQPLDFRTDVFSVGIMLYLVATGELPFTGKNPHEVLRRITDGKFADPRTVAHGVDERAARIMTRALARRPDDRYPDVAPMGDDLVAYLADAGLTDVRAELRAFFADPTAYEKALPARMAAALSASAARQLRERRLARAMELWNRVLAFDPQNAEVTAALDRLEGRRRLRRVSIALVAVGLLAAGPPRTVVERARRAAGARGSRTPDQRRPGPVRGDVPGTRSPRSHARSLSRRATGLCRRGRGCGPHANVRAGADAAERRRLPGRPAPVCLRPDTHLDRHPLEHRSRAGAAQPEWLLLRRAGRDRPGPPVAPGRDHRAAAEVAPGARRRDHRAAQPHGPRDGARSQPEDGHDSGASRRRDRRAVFSR